MSYKIKLLPQQVAHLKSMLSDSIKHRNNILYKKEIRQGISNLITSIRKYS